MSDLLLLLLLLFFFPLSALRGDLLSPLSSFSICFSKGDFCVCFKPAIEILARGASKKKSVHATFLRKRVLKILLGTLFTNWKKKKKSRRILSPNLWGKQISVPSSLPSWFHGGWWRRKRRTVLPDVKLPII